MDLNLIARLREQAEPLAGLSLSHLTPATRQKLLDDELSVNAYPTAFGGLVFVGAPRYSLPAETDLELIFEAAEQAGIVWLKFDREAAVIDGLQVFKAGQLQEPLHRNEAALRDFLADAQTYVILPRRGDDSIGARVRALLPRAQPAWPDLDATASTLHMSASTLQRRLASEGTSSQSFKDSLRRDVAIVRLNTSAVPLTTLACELRFADSAAFQRAFKGWTGSAPGAYRKGSP